MTFRYCLDKIQEFFPWLPLNMIPDGPRLRAILLSYQPISAILAALSGPCGASTFSISLLPLQMPVLLLGTVFPLPPCLVQLFPAMWSQKNLPRLQGLGTLPMWYAVFTPSSFSVLHHIWHHPLNLGTLIYKHHRGRGFSPRPSATSKEDLVSIWWMNHYYNSSMARLSMPITPILPSLNKYLLKLTYVEHHTKHSRTHDKLGVNKTESLVEKQKMPRLHA